MNSGTSKLYSGRVCELFKTHFSKFRSSLSAITVLERERCTLRLHAIATSRTSKHYNFLTTLWILGFQSSIQAGFASSSRRTFQNSQIRPRLECGIRLPNASGISLHADAARPTFVSDKPYRRWYLAGNHFELPLVLFYLSTWIICVYFIYCYKRFILIFIIFINVNNL